MEGLSHISCIHGARIPGRSSLWDIHIADGHIDSVIPHEENTDHSHQFRPPTQRHSGCIQAAGRLVAPSLCHAHIHLDKCFLLQDPHYSDLKVIKGDFDEAMEITSKAKSRFSHEDLLRRGRQLIEESIQSGVTAMRAFVEVDGVVGLKCLSSGLSLKTEFADRCEIQICAFAQLALFSGDDDGQTVRDLMLQAAEMQSVECLGSTPYVEDSDDRGRENVRWIAQLALQKGKHLDYHLDYFLDKDRKPLIWDALETLHKLDWSVKTEGTQLITFGHCTRLTQLSEEDWKRLRSSVGDLPVSFVSLPTSDLFMMLSVEQDHRGTLPIPTVIKKYELQAAIAVNNVGNAFTPQGSCDPLGVASLGIGLYGAGAESDAELLYETVSSRAKRTMSVQDVGRLDLQPQQPADLVLFPECNECPWRTRVTVPQLVYDPPPTRGRLVMRRGLITSK